MVKHAQCTQRLDEAQLDEVEFTELLVAFEQIAPLPLLLALRAGKHHPQVLNRGRHHAVVEIHEHRALLVPQQIAEVTVTVRAHLTHVAHFGEHSFDALERFGFEARDQVIDSGMLPASSEESYWRATDALLERVERVFTEVGDVRQVRTHGDCHLGNLLWNEQGPVFVDLDDCMMAPAIQDLWMMLSGPESEQQGQWRDLLEGYEQFREFDFVELRLIEPLRALRMLHHAAWLATRWSDPAFPRAFTWFGTVRFWESPINDLLEQVASIDDPPSVSVSRR